MSRERELVEPRHHRAEIIFGGLAFASGLFLASQIGTQLTWKPGQDLFRQPGFFSAVAILGMLLFGALELFFTLRRKSSRRFGSIGDEVATWVRAVEFALWFMAYVYVVPQLGYLPTTLIFCVLLTLRLGYRGWRRVLSALAVGAFTVLIFKSFLAVKLPGGALYEFLPDGLRNVMIQYF